MYEKLFLGSRNSVLRPKLHVSLGGTVKNTSIDRPSRMLPGVFIEFSWAVLLQRPINSLVLAQAISFFRRVAGYDCQKLGPGINNGPSKILG